MELIMAHVKYFWDEIEDNVVREYDESNNTIAQVTTEPSRYGSVLSQDRSGEKRYYQFDGQGSTTELTDILGNVTDTRRYSAFGQETLINGNTDFHARWMGKWGYFTIDTLTFARRRLNQSSLGRWLSIDPVQSVPDYRYTANSPLALIDPSGMRHTTITLCSEISRTEERGARCTLNRNGRILHTTVACPRGDAWACCWPLAGLVWNWQTGWVRTGLVSAQLGRRITIRKRCTSSTQAGGVGLVQGSSTSTPTCQGVGPGGLVAGTIIIVSIVTEFWLIDRIMETVEFKPGEDAGTDETSKTPSCRELAPGMPECTDDMLPHNPNFACRDCNIAVGQSGCHSKGLGKPSDFTGLVPATHFTCYKPPPTNKTHACDVSIWCGKCCEEKTSTTPAAIVDKCKCNAEIEGPENWEM